MLHVPSPDVQAILSLADFFDTLDPALYDQTTYLDFQTGARCICGWQNTRAGLAESKADEAAVALGLSTKVASYLFRREGGQRTVRQRWLLPDLVEGPTPREAAVCLRYLAVTGELPPNW